MKSTPRKAIFTLIGLGTVSGLAAMRRSDSVMVTAIGAVVTLVGGFMAAHTVTEKAAMQHAAEAKHDKAAIVPDQSCK